MASRAIESWASYPLNEQDPYWILQELPRTEARAQFERAMTSKSDRIVALRNLLEPVGNSLDGSDRDVQLLNDWFVEAMSPLSGTDTPDGVSLSVCEDVALYLGDLMISRHPELHWEFFTWGKKNVSYQCHVIMGFPFDGPALHANLDLARIVHSYGVHVLEARSGSPTILELPEGHPLNQFRLDPVPLKAQNFVELLDKTSRRFIPKNRSD